MPSFDCSIRNTPDTVIAAEARLGCAANCGFVCGRLPLPMDAQPIKSEGAHGVDTGGGAPKHSTPDKDAALRTFVDNGSLCSELPQSQIRYQEYVHNTLLYQAQCTIDCFWVLSISTIRIEISQPLALLLPDSSPRFNI